MQQSERKWLDNICEDDPVILDNRIRKVTRTTKTRIFIGATGYRREDGYMVGGSGYSIPRIQQATPERIDACNHSYRVRYLGALDWSELSTALVKTIYEMVKETMKG